MTSHNHVQHVAKSDARQEYFLQKAANVAVRSTMLHQHGSVIVDSKTNEIIATGYNQRTEYLSHLYSRHAEIDALLKIKKNVDLSNAEMYVVRIGPESTLKLSAPCVGCTKQILKSGLKNIFYSWSNIEYDVNHTKHDKFKKNTAK